MRPVVAAIAAIDEARKQKFSQGDPAGKWRSRRPVERQEQRHSRGLLQRRAAVKLAGQASRPEPAGR
jgi:hypothetical protein